MDSKETFYKGVRASDLRFDNVHLLAEFVQCAGILVNEAAGLQADSKELLSGALAISKEGTAAFEKGSDQMKATIGKAERAFRETIDNKGGELALLLNEAIGATRKIGIDLILQSRQAISAQTAGLTQAVVQLAQAANRAEANRVAANEARMKLNDYQKKLCDYEVVVHRRCKEALSNATAGLSFSDRVWSVFMPSKITVSVPKAPAKPKP